VEELPFGPNWLSRLERRLAADPVFTEASKYFDSPPIWTSGEGFGHHAAAALSAHRYCKAHVKEYDNGYRTPPSLYWRKFQEDRAAARGELVWTLDTSNVRISSLQDEYREAVASRYRNIYGKELDLTRLNADASP
jgi:hypothetical protein